MHDRKASADALTVAAKAKKTAAPCGPAPALDVLLVEDNPGDARLVRLMLEECGSLFRLRHAETLAAAQALIPEFHPDVVLLDLSLPDSQGLATVAEIHDTAPGTAIVVLTGNADDRVALKALDVGAQDYLVKGRGDGDLIARTVRQAHQRARIQAALAESEARFRAIFDRAALGIALIERDGRIAEANRAFAAMLGRPADALKSDKLADITHPEDLAREIDQSRDLLQGRTGAFSYEKRYLKPDGGIVWVREAVSLLPAAAEGAERFLCLAEDITERRRLEEDLRLAAKALESSGEGIMLVDAENKIVRVNPAFTNITGYDPADVLGKDPAILNSGRHDKEFFARMYGQLANTGHWEGEIWNRRKSGEIFAEWLTVSTVKDDKDKITHYVAVFSDITWRKKSEERLAHLANHDPLTDLPNRSLFDERLNRAIARALRRRQPVALLFIDLDKFKEVNDAHGHLIGDLLLKAVADRLAHCTRQGDTVARLAGDEFVVLVEDFDDLDDVDTVARKIIAELAEPFVFDGVAVGVTTSIGIALYPQDAGDKEALLEAADAAMYRAKKRGRDRYEFFDAALQERFRNRVKP